MNFLMIATSFQTLSVPAVAVSKYRYYFSTLSFDMPVHMRITIRASGNVKACLQRVVSFPPFCLLHTCSPKRAYIYVVVEASSAPSRGKRKRFSEKVIGSSAQLKSREGAPLPNTQYINEGISDLETSQMTNEPMKRREKTNLLREPRFCLKLCWLACTLDSC